MVANVPSDAKLRVDVYDKDEGQPSRSFPLAFHTCFLTLYPCSGRLCGEFYDVDRGWGAGAATEELDRQRCRKIRISGKP